MWVTGEISASILTKMENVLYGEGEQGLIENHYFYCTLSKTRDRRSAVGGGGGRHLPNVSKFRELHYKRSSK